MKTRRGIMKTVLWTGLLLFGVGCNNIFVDSFDSQSDSKASFPTEGERFVIQVGKTVHFYKEELTVQFESVPVDCRCPDGAVCIWEGYVEIQLKAQQKDQAPVTLALSTYGGDRDSVLFLNYSLQLVGVTPYPSIEEERDPTAYKADLILRKLW